MEQLELFTDEAFILRVPFPEAIRIFQENYWNHLPSAKVTKAHFRRLALFFKGYFLDSISKADIERYRRWMKEMGYAEATTNKAHMILSRIYRKFEEYKEGKTVNGVDFSRIKLPFKNPAAMVPKVSERRFARTVFITKEQKKILCSYADEDLSEIIDGLYWTELRPSDFFRITDKSIDLSIRVIFGIQNKTITTKNPSGVPFKVYIPNDKMEIIRRRIENTKPGTPLFRRKNIQKRWAWVRLLAKMPFIQMRDIRGSAASHLLDQGIDPETVRKTLGHTTLRMLPLYDKRPESRMMEATQILV